MDRSDDGSGNAGLQYPHSDRNEGPPYRNASSSRAAVDAALADLADVAAGLPLPRVGSLRVPTVELILVRHGLPERVELETGAADPPLSADGHEQARRVAVWLGAETIHAVYSSTMQRARQTAEPFAQQAGLELHQSDGIVEFDRDASSYVPMEELKEQDYEAWKDFVSGGYAEGIDFERFRSTALSTLDEIVERHRGERVAVFCHGGIINLWTAHVLGLPPRLFFEPLYTSIHRTLCASSGQRSLLSLNETAHLRLESWSD